MGLVNVKAGVQHLYERLESVPVAQAPITTMNDDTVVEVLNQCEEKLMKVLEAIAKVEDTEGVDTETLMPDAEDMSDSDLDEEEGDDVPDRDQMKKMSFLTLEKATKKTRKRGRRRKKGD